MAITVLFNHLRGRSGISSCSGGIVQKNRRTLLSSSEFTTGFRSQNCAIPTQPGSGLWTNEQPPLDLLAYRDHRDTDLKIIPTNVVPALLFGVRFQEAISPEQQTCSQRCTHKQ